jgi:dTDP-4-dehydrorhamnose 3,5-epimerase
MSHLKVEKTGLEGVLAITPPTNYEDFRGSYLEIYNHDLYQEAGITQDFIQDDISTSRQGVLRGIHGDEKTWKLISCLYGSFYLVVVNNNPSSEEFKKSISFTLSDRNRLQILVPPKFGNGHLVLSKEAIFHYKQTTNYDRSSQFTIKWNDPDYLIWWPTTNPILSQRDSE